MDIRSLLLLSRVTGVGSQTLIRLVSQFGDPGLILHSDARTLLTAPGINRKCAIAVSRFLSTQEGRDARRFVDHQLSRLKRIGGRILTLWDAGYPQNLSTIYDPPPFLFLRGTLRPADAYSIAMVGTRRPSPYGLRVAEEFTRDLVRRGITVVSGLARGIDTRAHRAAVESGGRTIAVMGTGIDVMYPPENVRLAGWLLQDGAILSEFEMGSRPDPSHFPRRNRIISGMTLGTLVVETGLDGGAMITAGMALDQNREVFAVPCPVGSPGVSGTNYLIKNGRAMLTESIDDLLQELGPRLDGIPDMASGPGHIVEHTLSRRERKVLDALNEHPTHINALAQMCNSTNADLLARLATLELRGLVRQSPGKRFTRT